MNNIPGSIISRPDVLLLAIVIFLGSASSKAELNKFGHASGSESPPKTSKFALEEEINRGSPERGARLAEIEGQIQFEDVKSSGRTYLIYAESLGNIDLNTVRKKGNFASDEIIKLLRQNRTLVEDIGGYDIRVIDVRESEVSGIFVNFRQFVDGVPVTPSQVIISHKGSPQRLILHVVNPDDQQFHSSAWLSGNTLAGLAREYWVEEFQRFPSEHSSSYEIFYHELLQEYIPIFKISTGGIAVAVNTITGELVFARDFSLGVVRQCRRNDGAPVPVGWPDCDYTENSVAHYTVFKNGFQCVQNSPFCMKAEYVDVGDEIASMRAWLVPGS